jgi:hypothetical protein
MLEKVTKIIPHIFLLLLTSNLIKLELQLWLEMITPLLLALVFQMTMKGIFWKNMRKRARSRTFAPLCLERWTLGSGTFNHLPL